MDTKSLIVKLQEPVEYDSKTYDHLEIGKFKAKHFRLLPKGMLDMEEDAKMTTAESLEVAMEMLPLIASMSNVPEEVIGELGISDLLEVVNQFGPFLEKSLPKEKS